MPNLPVHSAADIRLADAFGLPGCPLCRQRTASEGSYIESMLAEFVNDVPFRRELDRARGFCRAHVHALLEADRRRSGGLLAPAILFWAVLAVRGREVASAAESRGRSKSKRVAEARRPPQCPICSAVERADLTTAAGLAHLAADRAWAQALADAPLCLDHLLALLAHASDGDVWTQIQQAQLGRLRTLHDELESFAHRSSHDRRRSITDSQRASVDAAARLLGGER